jgi:DNA (cytosine-5)-methyltransferase 1
MRFGSLFSGIGGLDLGLERAGMTCAWQVEIDEWCRAVLARHWPDVPRWDDAKTFLAHSARNGRGNTGTPSFGGVGQTVESSRVELICGGFPCQPVSQAGKRRGQDDERWLWPEFARIIRLLRPRFVLVENVPGLLVRGMGDVLGDLAACGYDAEWDCIPAAAVGAPHLRYRVFIVAHAQRGGHLDGQAGEFAAEGGLKAFGDPGAGRGTRDVPDTDSRGLEGERIGGLSDRKRSTLGDDADGRDRAVPFTSGERWGPARPIFPGSPQGARALGIAARSDWWATEPDMGRVAHGIPSRVDRLRGLGNAVVPQVAEWIGRRLMES